MAPTSNILKGADQFHVDTTPDLPVLVNRGIAYVFILAFLLVIFRIFYGGIMLITSGGTPEKTKKAVGIIRHAIIGLVVALLAVTIVSLIGRIFGYDLLGKIVDFGQVWIDMQNIVSSMKTGGTSGGSLAVPSKGSLVISLFF